jgi:hypothetical protein
MLQIRAVLSEERKKAHAHQNQILKNNIYLPLTKAGLTLLLPVRLRPYIHIFTLCCS